MVNVWGFGSLVEASLKLMPPWASKYQHNMGNSVRTRRGCEFLGEAGFKAVPYRPHETPPSIRDLLLKPH